MRDCDGQICRDGGHLRRVAAGIVAAAWVTSIFGCGVGEYRQRIEKQVQELGTTSDAVGLYSAQPLGNKPIAVRVPQSFKRQPLVAGVQVAGEEAPPSDARVQTGLIDIPGLTYTYEEFVADAEGGQIPYYLYLGAADKTQPNFRDPASRWINQLKERFPGQEVAWEDVRCDTSDGQSVAWRRIRVEGDQDFHYVGKDGQGRAVKMPGVFEVYYRVDGNWAVVLAWRVPTSIAQHVDLHKWAPIVAGTVDFKG
ncbi:MAG: hypothetical protein RBS80_12755 [Thermoguttaceae bacterium]|nr:hypothetical protein [Thermoguttaceae bacterium]